MLSPRFCAAAGHAHAIRTRHAISDVATGKGVRCGPERARRRLMIRCLSAAKARKGLEAMVSARARASARHHRRVLPADRTVAKPPNSVKETPAAYQLEIIWVTGLRRHC